MILNKTTKIKLIALSVPKKLVWLTKRKKLNKMAVSGLSYSGSMYALGACGLGSTPSSPMRV